MKDYVGGVLENERSKVDGHCKRLIRIFQDWGDRRELLHDLMCHNIFDFFVVFDLKSW